MRAIFRWHQYVRDSSWPYVILFGVLANVPMWIAGGLDSIDVSGWFNLDFLFVGVLALFLPRAISAGLLLLAMVVDFMAEISLTYYITPREILSNAREIEWMTARLIAQFLVGGLLCFAIASCAFLLPRLKRRLATALLLVLFALVCRGVKEWELHWEVPSGFQLHRTAPQTVRAAVLRYGWTARSSTRQLISDERLDALRLEEESANKGQAEGPVESAAAVAYRQVLSDSRDPISLPDFVLIVVESWGQSSDEVIRQSLVEPYEANLGGRFTILQGSIPFHGATISAENRELCERSGGQDIMGASAADFRKCLPDELSNMGFHTIAIHGNHGTLYHRNEWYSRAGFQEIWFVRKLESEGLPDCVGAFTGVCDAAIATWIGKRLEQPGRDPRFVYWVTLNSHLPVPNPPQLPTLVPCDTDLSLARDLALCNWYRLTLNVHQSIASLAAHNGSRPAVYVIVGDHAPPFSDLSVRDSFEQRVVPYVILLPNGTLGQNSAAHAP